MPYNKDGSKKKQPTKKDWANYQRSQAKQIRKSSASNAGGASVGGGT